MSLLCCSHVFVYVSNYLAFKTTTKISIGFSDPIPVPKIIVCSHTNWTGSQVQQFFKASTGLEVSLVEGAVVKGDGVVEMRQYNRESELMVNASLFMRNRFKCVSLSYFIDSFNRSLFTRRMTTRMFQVTLYQWTCERGFMMYNLVDRSQPPYVDPANQVVSLTEDREEPYYVNRMFMTYQRTSRLLLPSPYDTRCRHYNRTGLSSQLHCQDVCLVRRTVARLHRLPIHAHYFADQKTTSSSPLLDIDESTASEESQAYHEMRQQCKQACHNRDCISHRYRPIATADQRGYQADRTIRVTKVRLDIPQDPDVVVESLAASTLEQLILDTVNSVSVWTGACPLLISRDLVRSLNRRLRRQASIGKQTRKSLSMILKAALFALCLAACAFQLMQSAQSYFAYPTTTNVRVFTQHLQQVPAMAVCTPIDTKRATVSDLMDQVTEPVDGRKVKAGETIYFTSVYGKCAMENEYCVTRFTPFVRSSHGCLLMTTNRTTYPTDDPERQAMLVVRWWAPSEDKQLIVSLVPTDDGFHSSFHSFVQQALSRRLMQQVSFSLFRQRLLPPPFDTGCRDYNDTTQFVSQTHCLQSCAVHESLARDGMFPVYDSPAGEWRREPFARAFSLNRTTWLSARCSSKCAQPDCVKQHFAIQSWSMLVSNISHWAMIHLSPSTQPVRETTANAVNDVLTFAIGFLSCAAFWTGLTPLALALNRGLLRRIRRFSSSSSRSNQGKLPESVYKKTMMGIAAAAYLWQVYLISLSYFSYSTVNRLDLVPSQQPELSKIPATDVCHYIEWQRRHNFTLFQANQVIGSVRVRYSAYGISRAMNLIRYHNFKLHKFLCHGISFGLPTSNMSVQALCPYSRDAFLRLQENDLFSFCISKCFEQRFMRDEGGGIYVAMHDDNVAHYDADSNVIKVYLIGPQHVHLMYSIVQLERMPRPYDTDCVTHHPDYNSSRDCFDSCYTDSFTHTFHSRPEDVPHDAVAGNYTDPDAMTRRQRDLLQALKQECRKKCGSDCSQAMFMVQKLKLDATTDGHWCLRVTLPQALVTLITFTARTTLFDFASVLLNGASFWLTFCPTSLLLAPTSSAKRQSKRVSRALGRKRQKNHGLT